MKEEYIIKEEKIYIPRGMEERKPLFLRHILHYEYIIDYIKNKKVLDVGCGNGYGSYLMSKYAKEVIGIDISSKCIKYAEKNYKRENLKFILMDALELDKNFSSQFFDIIVAMEFIEHLNNPLKFLKIAYELLKERGGLILSTPNKEARKIKSKPWNPEHVQEFDLISLNNLLSQVFPSVRIIGMSGTEKAIKYEYIRTGGNLPPYLKNLWRYTPEIVKKYFRKILTKKLPQDIKLEDFYFTNKINSSCFSLLAFCFK